jgi:hypothetical protein
VSQLVNDRLARVGGIPRERGGSSRRVEGASVPQPRNGRSPSRPSPLALAFLRARRSCPRSGRVKPALPAHPR